MTVIPDKLNDLEKARLKRAGFSSSAIIEHTETVKIEGPRFSIEPSEYAMAVIKSMLEYMEQCGLEPRPDIRVEVDADDPKQMNVIIPIRVIVSVAEDCYGFGLLDGPGKDPA